MAWPEVGVKLVGELEAHRGRLALVCGGPGLNDALYAIARLLNTSVFPVGFTLTSGNPPTSADEIESLLLGERVLSDLDILFWQPRIHIDVLRLLTRLAAEQPCIAAWPGKIRGRQATYSVAGRRDYYAARLADVVILRPRVRRFPDQMPFDVEHIPA